MDVLIIDDHPIIHEVLRAVVRKVLPSSRIRIEKEIDGAVSQARKLGERDLILLDLGLPGCTGLDSLRRIRKAAPKATVAIVSAADDPELVKAAFDEGARGYIPKTSTPGVMVAAVRLVAQGETYVPPHVLREQPRLESRRQNSDHAKNPLGLTDRQFEVLRLLLRGYHNREIADRLDIVEGTVKQHTHAVFQALKVGSRAEAIAVATKLQLKID